MTEYYKCPLSQAQHILAFIVSFALGFVFVYIFYHLVWVSILLGLPIAWYLERTFAQASIKRRQNNLRIQFRTFLQSMSVATGAGRSPTHAMEAALEDLKISYRDDADIVVEISTILQKYNNGGIPMPLLLKDFADRSGLEDIESFASIYAVIDGKAHGIGKIVSETAEIIGDKIQIEQEITTAITSAKSETYMMLIMPVIIVLAMTFMGGELLEALFTTSRGHMAATIALVLFAVSYIMSNKLSDIRA